jgi:hypothetical protein
MKQLDLQLQKLGHIWIARVATIDPKPVPEQPPLVGSAKDQLSGTKGLAPRAGLLPALARLLSWIRTGETMAGTGDFGARPFEAKISQAQMSSRLPSLYA